MTASGIRCAILCRVIDNFGDAGICWRLGRQLLREYGWQVTLYIDDSIALGLLVGHSIRPPTVESGIEIRPWGDAALLDADCVIEAFACRMPDTALQALALRKSPFAWINLEYLTAEAWAAEVHGLESPHPQLPLSCLFFVPGFEANTGGLIREQDLTATRSRWLRDPAAQSAFWSSLGDLPRSDQPLVSLFAYADGATERCLARWAAGTQAATIIVNAPLADRLGLPEASWGPLTIRRVPFLDQDRYDRLLWSCDLNLVRGEDSFVRALWAARPFIWQPYRQEEDAHRAKLRAFLDRYLPDFAEPERTLLERAFFGWNDGVPERLPDLSTLVAHLAEWERQTAAISERWSNLPNLAGRLAQAVQRRLEC